jgi:PKHD-type hydroxylase
MQLEHNFYYFPKALNKETCQKIITHGLNTMNLAKGDGVDVTATTFGGKDKGKKDDAGTTLIHSQDKLTIQGLKKKGIDISKTYVRDSYVSWLGDKWLYDLIMPYVNYANKETGWNWELNGQEMFQFTMYKGGGYYGWHTDGHSDHFGSYKKAIPGVTKKIKDSEKWPKGYTDDDLLVGKNRKISVTINLTEKTSYKGGDLRFDMGAHSAKRYVTLKQAREQGSIIIFPSFLYHQVTPVTQGTRYSLVLWTLGPPFK